MITVARDQADLWDMLEMRLGCLSARHLSHLVLEPRGWPYARGMQVIGIFADPFYDSLGKYCKAE